MAYTQIWSIPVQELPVAICQWGSDHLFIGYGNGLLEIRSMANGDVVAQGYSPFDQYGGSGGAAITGAGYCDNGIGVVVCQVGGRDHVLATIRANLTAKSMDVGANVYLPLGDSDPARPPADRAVSMNTTMSDGAPLGFSYDNAALATTTTGGMLLIPVVHRGETTITTPGQPTPGDTTRDRTATLYSPGSTTNSYFRFLNTRITGSTFLRWTVTQAFAIEKFDWLVITYTTVSGHQETHRYQDSADKQPGETSIFAVGKNLAALTNFTAGDPLQHIRITRESSDGTLLDVYTSDNVVYDPVPDNPGTPTTRQVPRAPGMLGAWFDVRGFNDIRWTATRAQIGRTAGQMIAVIRGGLRAITQTRYRTAFQEFDRDQPMPIPVAAPSGVEFGVYLEVTHDAPGGAVINLVPLGMRNDGPTIPENW